MKGLWTCLLFAGTLLGITNISVTLSILIWLHHSSFYEKFGFFHYTLLIQLVMLFFLAIPCVLSTALMLYFSRAQLALAQTKKEHVRWGILFGIGATILSTLFMVAVGAIFNWILLVPTNIKGQALLLLIPGVLAFAILITITFFPSIAISGSLYGLLAMKIKSEIKSRD